MLTQEDFKSAIEGEGWAIGDYKDMISRADKESERLLLTTIMNDEKEHLGYLMKLRNCI